MKSLLFISLFILFASNTFAQNGVSTNLSAYLKNKGYTALTDTANLPKAVKDNYKAITGYLLLHFKKFDDYYVSHVSESNTTLYVRLEALGGITLNKEMLEREIKENEAIKNKTDTIVINGKKTEVEKLQIIDAVTGNLGGKDGVMELDKASRQIKFRMWQ